VSSRRFPAGFRRPHAGAQAGSGAISQYFFAVSETRRLRAELKAAQSWRTRAIALQDTNDRYRALLGLKVNPPIDMVSGLAVADFRGPFANSRLINVGSEARVEVGNPVMNENGLVGRIVGVAEGVSRVLLLTDVASRTPVLVDRTNSRAILVGDGGPNPRLDYLRGQEPVKGKRPHSDLRRRRGPASGHTDRAGGEGSGWSLEGGPGGGLGSIDYIRVLLFKDFRQLANTPRLDVPPPPPPPTTPGGCRRACRQPGHDAARFSDDHSQPVGPGGPEAHFCRQANHAKACRTRASHGQTRRKPAARCSSGDGCSFGR